MESDTTTLTPTQTPTSASSPNVVPAPTPVAMDYSGIVDKEGKLASDWTKILPEDVKGEEYLKVFKDLPSLVKSSVELKKKLGSIPRLPTDKSAPEDWNKVYDALGRPSKPEEYEVKRSDKLPKEILEYEKESIGKFAAKAHELGLSKKQFNGMLELYDSSTIEGLSKSTQEAQMRQAAQEQASVAMLKQKWGRDYEVNKAKADLAYQHLNPDGNMTNMEIFAKLAEYIGEDTIGSGASNAEEFVNIENSIQDGYSKLRTLPQGSKAFTEQVDKINMLIKRKVDLKGAIL